MSSSLTALVTGASRGIGRAIAVQLAARGCRVAVHYHTQRAAAQETLGALGGAGHQIFAADLSAASDAARLWSEATQAFGRVDIVVNNAGTYSDHPPLTTTLAEWQSAWQRTISANLIGPANLSHLAVNAM